MKSMTKTRLLSVLLTLSLLVGLMPAAFAASYDDYMDEYVDLDDYLDWSETDFDKIDEDTFDSETYFIEIYAEDNNAPLICYNDDDSDAEGDWLDWDADIYFDADSR